MSHRPKPEFKCLKCGKPWAVPPHTYCPTCGPGTPAEVPDLVWSVDRVGDTNLFISGHLRDQQRLDTLIKVHEISTIVDVANDPGQHIVWRPDKNETPHDLMTSDETRFVLWRPVWGMKDTPEGRPFPTHTLDTAIDYIAQNDYPNENILVSCAAGLRRAPHVVYAYLRYKGFTPRKAWGLVVEARPGCYEVPGYIDHIESWLRDQPVLR